MNDFSYALQVALQLIGGLDAELQAIILLSLQVSLTGSVRAFAIGAPLGTTRPCTAFRGNQAAGPSTSPRGPPSSEHRS
jgi:tungstate transport system permease protein